MSGLHMIPLGRRWVLGATALVAGVSFLNPALTLAQCSLCVDAVAASPQKTREAMNYAILGLAIAPYGVGAMATWFASPGLRAWMRERARALIQGKKAAGV